MNAVENFGQIQRMEKAEAVEKKLYNLIGEEVDEAFDRNVQAQLMNPEMIARMGDKLNIVYTPCMAPAICRCAAIWQRQASKTYLS